MSGFYLAEHFVDHKKVPRHGCGGGEEADGTFRVEVPTQKPKVPVPVLKAALDTLRIPFRRSNGDEQPSMRPVGRYFRLLRAWNILQQFRQWDEQQIQG